MTWLLFLLACGDAPGPAKAPSEAASSASTVRSTAPTHPAAGASWEIGRAATPEEIAAWDLDVDPTGRSLPPGKGTVPEGQALFQTQCAACHGLNGEGGGNGMYPALIGAEPKTGFAEDYKIHKTIGNWWPYPTTIFDYVRRAMPQTMPGSLTDPQIYALTAYLLHANGAVPADFVADATSVPQVKMPTKVQFIRDDRPETTSFR